MYVQASAKECLGRSYAVFQLPAPFLGAFLLASLEGNPMQHTDLEAKTSTTNKNQRLAMPLENFNKKLDAELEILEELLTKGLPSKAYRDPLTSFVLIRELRRNPTIHMAIDEWGMSGYWLWNACEQLQLTTVLYAIEKTARASRVDYKAQYCYGILKRYLRRHEVFEATMEEV